MTFPLEGHIYIDPDHAKAAAKFGQKQLVKDFIDTGWMHQKGLKWIGWDIQGWLAWTDPNGMLYRIKDLKRNEDGVAFEKEVNEVKSELTPRTHQGNPSAEALYRFERDMQKDCGFCPGDRRGSVDPEVDRKPGMDAQPEEEINLDELMKGDYSPFVPGGYNGVIDQEEITTTGFVTYGGYIDEWSGGDGNQDGGIVKEIIDPVGVLPPKPLPTPPEKQTPPGKRGLPDMPKGPTDTKPVTTLPPNPFKPTPPKFGPPGNPGSEGTYPVTPTNPYPPKPQTPTKPTAKPMPKPGANQKPQAGGQNGTPKKDAADLDIDKAAKHLDQNAGPKSEHRCAKAVREALVAGGLNTSGNPRHAKDYIDFLPEKGFEEVPKANYVPQKGDIAVFQNYPGGSPSGHIQMYNGDIWESDFKQPNFWPGSGYRKADNYKIFRKP